MDYHGYKVLVDPLDEEGVLRGRVLMREDDVRFSASDMLRFRKEAASAIDFYLSACDAAGRQPDPPATAGEWVVLSDTQRTELDRRAGDGRTTASRVLNEIVTSALGV